MTVVALDTLVMATCFGGTTRARADEGAAEGKRLWAERASARNAMAGQPTGMPDFIRLAGHPRRDTQLTRDQIR